MNLADDSFVGADISEFDVVGEGVSGVYLEADLGGVGFGQFDDLLGCEVATMTDSVTPGLLTYFSRVVKAPILAIL